MTERLLRLPSDEYREMKEKYELELAKQKEENAKLTAENRHLQEQLRLVGANSP